MQKLTNTWPDHQKPLKHTTTWYHNYATMGASFNCMGWRR